MRTGASAARHGRGAERAPGVIAVITSRNMPPVAQSVDAAGWRQHAAPRSGHPLQRPDLAVVVAETFEQARARGRSRARRVRRTSAAGRHGAAPREMRSRPTRAIGPPSRSAAISTQAAAGAARARRPDLPHADRAPQPDGAACAPSRSWERRPPDRLRRDRRASAIRAQNLAEAIRGLAPDARACRSIPSSAAASAARASRGRTRRSAALAAQGHAAAGALVLTRRQMFTSQRPSPADAAGERARPRSGTASSSRCATTRTTTRRSVDEFMEPTGLVAVASLYSCANVEIDATAGAARRSGRRRTCGRRASRAARSGSRPRWTSSRRSWASTRSSCDSRNYAEIDESTGNPLVEQVAARLLRARRRALRLGAARPASRRRCATVAGWWATAWRPPTYPANFRPAGAKAIMHADGTVRDAVRHAGPRHRHVHDPDADRRRCARRVAPSERARR